MRITPTLMLLSWVLHVHGDPSPISEQLESASDDFILASELSDDRNLALRGSHSDAMNDNSSSEPVILSDERSLGPFDELKKRVPKPRPIPTPKIPEIPVPKIPKIPDVRPPKVPKIPSPKSIVDVGQAVKPSGSKIRGPTSIVDVGQAVKKVPSVRPPQTPKIPSIADIGEAIQKAVGNQLPKIRRPETLVPKPRIPSAPSPTSILDVNKVVDQLPKIRRPESLVPKPRVPLFPVPTPIFDTDRLPKNPPSVDDMRNVAEKIRDAGSTTTGDVIDKVMDTGKTIVVDRVSDAVEYENTCTTEQEKAKFEAGGWKATYLPPLPDSKVAGTVAAGVVIAVAGTPASAAAYSAFVADQLVEEMNKNADGAEEFMNEVGNEGQREFEKAIGEFLRGGVGEKKIPLKTMDIKAALIRVNCKNCVRGKCMVAEGNYRIALAYRVRQGVPKIPKVPTKPLTRR